MSNEIVKQPDAGSGGGALAQFEAWAVSIGARTDKGEHGNYLSSALNYSKMGWDALAARQPVGVEPVAWAYIGEIEAAQKLLARGLADGNVQVQVRGPEAMYKPLYDAPPAPAAVPVDGGIAFRLTALRSSLAETLDLAEQADETDAANNIGVDLKTLDSIIEDILATHPQPAAADRGDA